MFYKSTSGFHISFAGISSSPSGFSHHSHYIILSSSYIPYYTHYAHSDIIVHPSFVLFLIILLYITAFFHNSSVYLKHILILPPIDLSAKLFFKSYIVCCCCLPIPMTLASVWSPVCGPSASFSVHLASSAVTPAGSVHKSMGDNVVCRWVQLKR